MKKQSNPQLTRAKRILRSHLPEMQTRYKVKSLGLFGSYIRGAQRKQSDLDVLVEFRDPNLSLLKFIEMENYLTDLLGVKVDLVEKSGLKPRIGEQILREVVPL
ncbi:MAG: nucleotidyltransferase family protein [Chloroflexi bacterium]|nr:nucleotidyltransferase family protein [Chloroflexota bacterium]